MTSSKPTMLLTVAAIVATLISVTDLQAGGCHSSSRGYYPFPVRYFQPPVCVQPRPKTLVRIIPQTSGQPQRPFGGTVPQQGTAAQLPGVAAPQQAAVPTRQSALPGQQSPLTAQSGTASANSAQMSALQALAAMTGADTETQPTQAPAAQSSATHVGNWTANLTNGAQVQLQLQANGTFNWLATNKSGKTSKFQGSYTVGNGSLTLVRSNDNIKLSGSMTKSSNNAFNFRLAGAKDSGLSFSRS